MSINIQKIKKWVNMMLGNSSYHVNQDEGKIYSTTEIKGYYNNLTEKVTRFGLQGDQVPKTVVDTGDEILFPIAIFQYGLAAYDLFLLGEGDREDRASKVIACANWALNNQQSDGSWKTFSYEDPRHPYSSMAQGEAISLLVRAYNIVSNDEYLNCAKKALKFMLLPIEAGGTTLYKDKDIFFYECTHEPLILNGWIFSLWGVLDYYKFFNDEKSRTVYETSIKSLKKKLPVFDLGYWSKYEEGRRISSPFYHNLHIAQLRVMHDLTGDETFSYYAELFEKYQANKVYRWRAFIKKAVQKVME